LSDPSIYRTSPATMSSPFTARWRAKNFFAATSYCLTVWFVFDHCKKKTTLDAILTAPATIRTRADASSRAARRTREQRHASRDRAAPPHGVSPPAGECSWRRSPPPRTRGRALNRRRRRRSNALFSCVGSLRR
jgi:hypothetical protein